MGSLEHHSSQCEEIDHISELNNFMAPLNEIEKQGELFYLKEECTKDIIDLFASWPTIKNKTTLLGSSYDILEHYHSPPVIGVGRVNDVDTYGKEDFLSFDSDSSNGNGLFIEYKGRRIFLTVEHVGSLPITLLYLNSGYLLAPKRNDSLDVLYVDTDDLFTSDLGIADSDAYSVVEDSLNNEVQSGIVQIVGYDTGGDYREEYPSLSVLAGFPIKITQEQEDRILDYLGDIHNGNFEGDRGRYAGKYMFKISAIEYFTAVGLSGSPAFIEGEFIGILSQLAEIDGNHFALISDIVDIKRDLLD